VNSEAAGVVLSLLDRQARFQACGQLHRGAGMIICMIGIEDRHGKDEKITSRDSAFCGARCPSARFVAAKTGRSYNLRLQACRQLHGGADITTCIPGTDDDVEPEERLIKRNSALHSNLSSRARFVTAKGAEPADSRLQDCGQLQGGADIVTCIVGNGDCLQADLELVSRNAASHVGSAVESGLRLPKGQVLQVRDSRQQRRQRGAEQHPGT